MASCPHVFEYPYSVADEVPFEMKEKWNESFGNNNPIVIELGCGRGKYTVGLGEKFSDVNFIGVDIKDARVCGAVQQNHFRKE